MNAKQIFDIQSEITKRCNRKGSLYYYLKQGNDVADIDVFGLSSEWIEAIDRKKVSDSLVNQFNEHIYKVDAFSRIVPDWVYYIAEEFRSEGESEDENLFNVVTAYYSLLPFFKWCETSKAVYTISKGLANSFKEQLKDEVELYFNFDSIKHLPHSNFYIDCRAAGIGDNVGAFVSVITHNDTIVFWASIWKSNQNTITSMTCRYTAKEDGIIKVSLEPEHVVDMSEDDTISENLFPLLLSIIAYMGSEDADVLETTERVAKPRKGSSKVQNRKEYQIGYRVGQKLEEARQRYRYLSEHHDGSTKRPHIRKAHWHSFWVGKKNSDKRKIVVKWVAETYVNCETAEMVDIVDRLVDKATKEG